MDIINTNCLYEICKYLTFKEMNYIRIASNKYMKKVETVMIILSEREANRILLSANNIHRNPWIDHEEPKFVLNNHSWYVFLIDQIQKRWRIRKKLFKLIPTIFGECDRSFSVGLTNLMFTEIKKKRAPKNRLNKDDVLINMQTEFQELLFKHSIGKKSDKYDWKVMNDDMYENSLERQEEFVEEIVKNKESYLFHLFRWYKNYQEDDSYLPKSRILWFLFCVDEFVKNHCMTIWKSIASKWNNETFLDEYSTRWNSFVDLIEIFETEFSFIEVLVNNMYAHDDIQNTIEKAKSNYPKFSFLRLMCRVWGKYVMKELFDKFSEKVTSILVTYQDKLLNLIENYEDLKKCQKFFIKHIENEFSINKVETQVLRHALQMVLDISINEYSVKQLGGSKLSLYFFYPKIEEKIMRQTKPFLNKLFKECSAEVFKTICQLYMNSLNRILIRRSQRRLHNLVYASICINIENKIK